METFIGKVAEEVFRNHKDSLNKCCIVFPTRRACGSFNIALAKHLTKPVFSPSVITINDFILEKSENEVPDKYTLLVILFHEYRKIFPSINFVKFFHWGQMLLSDFDEIDRNLADAKTLFSNLEDLKLMDTLFADDAEQQEALSSFIDLFDKDNRTDLQETFLGIWERLFELYTNYSSTLVEQGLTYEGKAYREFNDKLHANKISFEWNTIYFAGFYALSESENSIFQHLIKNGLAECLWDTDSYYSDHADPISKYQEAGKYLRKNKLLAEDYKWQGDYFKQNIKNLTVTGVSQRSGQADYIGQVLQESVSTGSWDINKTVLVLADEGMLFPVLNHLPAEVNKLNISMGYPLKASRINEWLELVINIKRNSSNYLPSAIIDHFLGHSFCDPFIRDKKEKNELLRQAALDIDRPLIDLKKCLDSSFLDLLLSKVDSCSNVFQFMHNLLDIQIENADAANDKILLSSLKDNLQQLLLSISGKMDELDSDDAWHLIRDIRNSLSVPFDSHDGSGLQIMGFLETRLLDFENVIITPVNEDSMPASSRFQTFIPFSLRKAFGLSTFQDKDAVYAYHFYRLLQRAKNVELIYNTKTGSIGGGDKSRYLLQIKHEMKEVLGDRLNFREQMVNTPFHNIETKPISVSKSTVLYKRIQTIFGEGKDQKAFSSSSLLSFIKCPLQFYFNYIVKLRDDSAEDEVMDASAVGNVVHAALEKLYADSKRVDVDELKAISAKVDLAVNDALEQEYKFPNEKIRGKNLLTMRAIKAFVLRALNIDQSILPFTMSAVEEKKTIEFSTGKRKVKLGGIIDRSDKRNGVLWISDYKTGAVHLCGPKSPFKMEDLEKIATKKPVYFQLLMYAILKTRSEDIDQLMLGVYPLKSTAGKYELIHDLRADKDDYLQKFSAILIDIIERIFDKDQAFEQTSDQDICKYCDYKGICGR